MQKIAHGPFKGLGLHHYGAILADPPWKYRAGGNRKAPYPTMDLEELKAMPVRDLAAPDCALFMWTSGPFLHWSMDLMKHWGFSYKTYAFGWVKTWPREAGRLFVDWQEVCDGPDFDAAAMGTGHWTHSNLELVLLGTRNRPERISTGVRQLIVDARGDHSAKPLEVHGRIERLVMGPYLELFARRSMPGWITWGNEREKFDFKPVQNSEA